MYVKTKSNSGVSLAGSLSSKLPFLTVSPEKAPWPVSGRTSNLRMVQ